MTGNLNMNEKNIINSPQLKTSGDILEYRRNNVIFIDGRNKMTENLDMNKKKVINLGNPENENDAVTKKYVDSSLKNISSSSKTNSFYDVMKNINYWIPLFHIRNIKFSNFNSGIHSINWDILEFEIEREVKSGSEGKFYWYLGRMQIDITTFYSGYYTLCLEIIPEWNINTDINLSGIELIKKVKYNFGNYVKFIFQIKKKAGYARVTFEINFDLKHDVAVDFHNEWADCKLILYGIVGLSDNINSEVSDKYFLFEK